MQHYIFAYSEKGGITNVIISKASVKSLSASFSSPTLDAVFGFANVNDLSGIVWMIRKLSRCQLLSFHTPTITKN